MRVKTAGFTLIELIAVLVVMGIMAAVAIPKYIDLKEEARKGVAKGVTGALWGSIQLRHARYLMAGNDYTVKDVVDGLMYQNLTMTYGSGTIGAHLFGQTFEWIYTNRSGNEMAVIKENF